MPSMGLEKGAASVFDIMGRYEPSRAINPSEGKDPVSLGMVPPAPAPAGRVAAVPSAAPHADPPPMEPEPEMAGSIGQGVEQPPAFGAYAVDNLIDLAAGVAHFRGRHFQLSGWAMANIITTLVHQLKEIYDAELTQLYGIAAALHEEERQRAALSLNGSTEPNAMREVPNAPAEGAAEPEGQSAATDVQPLPPAAPEERGVPGVPRSRPRKPVAKTGPRQDLPHPDAGATA